MATRQEIFQAIRNADAAGDSESVRKLSSYLRSMPKESAPMPAYNVTDDMGTGERLLAGIGMGIDDLYMGAKQRLGLASQAEIDDKRRTDEALRNTTAGSVGNVLGKVAVGLPAAFIPGANTIAGAGLIGGAQGILEPTATGESVAKNAVIGGAAGVVGVVAGRALRAGYQGAKALIEPFTSAGQQRIAGRVLERFAENPNALRNANGAATATGAMPTLAEATKDRGVATLQRALEQQDPQIANAMSQRAASNNAARVGVLQDLAGDEARRKAADAARKAATGPLYKKAAATTVEVDKDLSALLSRPSVQRALGRAGNIAGEQGRKFGLSKEATIPASSILDASGMPMVGESTVPGKITGQTLQDIKMALDDMLKDPTTGMAGKEGAAVRETRDALMGWMEKRIPEYQAARQGWAAGTKPLNQMDVGQRLLDKTTAAIRDMGGNPRLQANALSRALNDEQGLVRGATGFKGVNSLEDVLTPQQISLLNALRGETELASNLSQAANGAGSQTAKSLASQNLLRQTLGPTGLPQSWAESTILESLMRPVQFGMKAAEPRIQNKLSEILLDPALARRALESAQPAPMSPAMQSLLPYFQQAAQQSIPATFVSGQR